MAFPSPQLPESMKSFSSPTKIHLYTASTPNGVKVSVLLEELVLAYPDLAKTTLAYDYTKLSIRDPNHAKYPEFLKINPNGRIPAIVDDNVQVDGKGHNVFESVSCMLWLVERYDKDLWFWFDDPVERSRAYSWIFFIHGAMTLADPFPLPSPRRRGPMQGQANHFSRRDDKIDYAIKRYVDETKRLYSVLEDGLNAGTGEWLVGDKYSIVDMSAFGWVRVHGGLGIEMGPYPKLDKWIDRIGVREGAKNGLNIPPKST